MHFCSYTGDVDPWWMIAFFYWGFSQSKMRTDFVNQFLIANSMPIWLTFSIKLTFHASRPYQNKIELADLTLKEYVSAEFGNPSGHSMSSIANPLFFYYYFT